MSGATTPAPSQASQPLRGARRYAWRQVGYLAPAGRGKSGLGTSRLGMSGLGTSGLGMSGLMRRVAGPVGR